MIDFKSGGVETCGSRANTRRNLGLVLRISQLRGLGALGVARIKCRRLRNRAGNLVRNAIYLEEKKPARNYCVFFRKHFQKIFPSFPKTISARIFDSGVNGVSRRRDVCAE
ncbi:MAG TPA: hypothetical protein VFC85_02245 [Verrucomicrobiae bacterium]|nr:hypothetical protein [Verrucomicrobiae bacterium]